MTAVDSIVIQGLRLDTHIGVTEEERETPQFVLIDLEVDLDLRAAGESDRVTDTLDYGIVTDEVAALVRSGSRRLLERLAEEIAGVLLAHMGVLTVSVDIAKESPPITENVGRIAVRIERQAT